MTKKTKPSANGDSQIDLKRRRAMLLVAAVTVLGTGLGIPMNEVFADDKGRAPPEASQSKSSPDLMRPGAQQQKASPKLMTNCASENGDSRDIKAAPGADQRKSSPKLMLNCADGAMNGTPRNNTAGKTPVVSYGPVITIKPKGMHD